MDGEFTCELDGSVVVPTLTATQDLREQLRSLGHQIQKLDLAVEVLVVGPERSKQEIADSVRAVAAAAPITRVIATPTDEKPAPARNFAATRALGRVLLFCDSDDIVAPGWLENLHRALHTHDLAAGRCVFRSNHREYRSAENVSTSWFAPYEFLPYGVTANLGIRASLFRDLGGLNLEFRSGHDVDLCWRAQLSGHRLACVSDAVVWKARRGTPLATFLQHYRYGRFDARLYKTYRTAGMSRNWEVAGKSHLWILANLPLAWRSNSAHAVARVAGTRFGRLRGSLEHGVLFP